MEESVQCNLFCGWDRNEMCLSLWFSPLRVIPVVNHHIAGKDGSDSFRVLEQKKDRKPVP